VLFISTKTRWEKGQAIRGKIPICFPWFRAKADDPHAPAHGFVRTKPWELESIAETEAGVAVTMFTDSDEHTRRRWPGKFRLGHRVTFGSEMSLSIQNVACLNTDKLHPLTVAQHHGGQQIRFRQSNATRHIDVR
jgi:glucose-6-phosphate 1-epimerase